MCYGNKNSNVFNVKNTKNDKLYCTKQCTDSTHTINGLCFETQTFNIYKCILFMLFMIFTTDLM